MSDFYIKLKADTITPLEAMKWSSVVHKHLPSGVAIASENSTNGLYDKVTVDGFTEIIIPLSRDILQREFDSINSAWSALSPSGRYSIEISRTQNEKLNGTLNGLSIDGDSFNVLSTQLAKKQHERWVREKTSEGWRYGLKLSVEEKTHPLLRPWDQLPDQYKQLNHNDPDSFLNIIKDQGYSIISNKELDNLLKLLKNIL